MDEERFTYLVILACIVTTLALIAPSRFLHAQVRVNSSPPQTAKETEYKERISAQAAQLIARAEDHFKKGKLSLESNQHERARAEFDRAVDTILEAGLDVRTNQRLQAYYLELVERIYREEVSPWPPGTSPYPVLRQRQQIVADAPAEKAARGAPAGTSVHPGRVGAGSLSEMVRPAPAVKSRRKLQLDLAPRAARRPLSPREIARRSFPSVVLLSAPLSDGRTVRYASGFFVAADTIVTNYHVIENTREVFARIVDQEKVYRVTQVIAYDQRKDLALLGVQGTGARPLPLADGHEVGAGDEVYALGNPQNLGGTISPGIISAIRKTASDRMLQFTAPISPGSSGGPLLNNRGEVVGVTIGAREGGQNLNFAVPSSELLRLIEGIAAP